MLEASRGRQLVKLLAVLMGMALWSVSWGPLPSPRAASQIEQVAAMSAGALTSERSDLAPAEVSEAEDVEIEDACDHVPSLAPPRALEAQHVASTAPRRPCAQIRLHAGHESFARQRGPPLG